MNREQLLSCVGNVTQGISPLTDSAYTYDQGDETPIDFETYTITKICLTIALLSSVAHLALFCSYRRLFPLYGICIALELILFPFIHLFTLVTCSLKNDTNRWRIVIGKLADFTIMSTVSTNLMSSVHVARQLWLGVTLTPHGTVRTVGDSIHVILCSVTLHCGCRVLYRLICFPIIVLLPASIILIETQLPNQLIHTGDLADFANVSCNLVPDFAHLYLFFPTMGILLIGQLICLGVAIKLRYERRQDEFLLAHLSSLNVRLWITMKLAVTYCLVWTTAFVAVYYASIALWHVFILFCSLQSIYVTLNSMLNRHVLNVIHRWHEDKVIRLKVDQLSLNKSSAPNARPVRTNGRQKIWTTTCGPTGQIFLASNAISSGIHSQTLSN